MANAVTRLVRNTSLLRAGVLRARSVLRSLKTAKPGVYTLLYHRVPASARQSFEAQIRFLKGHGTFIDVDSAAAMLADGWRGTERAFVLTFDDGQADNVDVALPILCGQGIPAIQFLVSDWLDDPPPATGRAAGYMTRADVKNWLAAGLKIGSHSASHPRLARLDSTAARAELLRSRDALSDLAGTAVTHFACPWGVAHADFDPARDPALARECGYGTFFTTRRGRALGAADLFAMPRHVLEPHWSLHHLQALLGGWKRAGA